MTATAAFPDPWPVLFLTERGNPALGVVQAGLSDKAKGRYRPSFRHGESSSVTQKRQKLMTLRQYSPIRR